MRAILVGSVVAGIVIGGMVAGVVYVTRADPPPAAKPSPPPPAPRPAPKKVEPVKKAEPVPEPLPSPAEPASFAADWKAARGILEERYKGWQVRADKSMRALTAAERADAAAAIRDARLRPGLMAEDGNATTLDRLGLDDTVRAISASYAVEDASFRAVVRAVWTSEYGADGIIATAERWGRVVGVERQDVARAVARQTPTARLPTETRNAFLTLGLRHWLTR